MSEVESKAIESLKYFRAKVADMPEDHSADVAAFDAAIASLEALAYVARLFEFYGVTTLNELVHAQALHVEHLIAKLPPTPDTIPGPVRGG